MSDDGRFTHTGNASQFDQTICQDIALTIVPPGFRAAQVGFMGDKTGSRLNNGPDDLLSAIGRLRDSTVDT